MPPSCVYDSPNQEFVQAAIAAAPELDDRDDVYAGRVHQWVIADAYGDMLVPLAPWKYIAHLTLKPDTAKTYNGTGYQVPRVWSPEAAQRAFRWLVRCQNAAVFGSGYRRVVKGRSYFSYAVFTEPQVWGATHLHAVMTGPLHMARWHQFWQHGHMKISRLDDPEAGVRYGCKYIGKGGELVDAFIASEWATTRVPDVVQSWWRQDGGPLVRQDLLPVDGTAVNVETWRLLKRGGLELIDSRVESRRDTEQLIGERRRASSEESVARRSRPEAIRVKRVGANLPGV